MALDIMGPAFLIFFQSESAEELIKSRPSTGAGILKQMQRYALAREETEIAGLAATIIGVINEVS